MPLAELLQLFSTFAMVGVIWTVQLLLYPAFAEIPADGFALYHRRHTRRISFVVVPLMTVELVTAVSLAAVAPTIGRPVQVVALALTLALWAVTAAVQVPLHNALARGRRERLTRQLVATNWLRTGLWTAKAALLTASYWRA